MKRLSIIFLFSTFFGLTTISAFAQIQFVNNRHTTYLDADYRPATAANYIYKRVIKWKEPIIIKEYGTDDDGDLTIRSKASGYHNCTVTDYYKTGEIALIGNMTSSDENCSQLTGRNGQFIAYYKDGTIKRKETRKYDKLEGVVIYYDEEGSEAKREEYVSGNLIEEGKFSAPADSPIIGTWKYVEYSDSYSIFGAKRPPIVARTLTLTYAQNGVVDSIQQIGVKTSRTKGNWKYTPKTASSGVLEEYLGEDLVERASVRFLSRKQLEYTVTFSEDSNLVGKQCVWTRE